MRPEELTPVERRLWEAFPTAAEVDLRSGRAEADDPAGGAAWGAERTVRAEVIAALLLGIRDPEPGRVAGISLVGARIIGALDLDHTEFGSHLRLKACWFEQQINLYCARTRQLSIIESQLPGMLASHADIDGNLRLRGCRTTGEIRLFGARISGALMLDGAHLVAPPDGHALTAERLHVENDVLMRHGFTAEGTVVLRSAQIGGSVQMGHARLRGSVGQREVRALDASRLRIAGDLSAHRLNAHGILSLRGAAITGTLFLRSAVLDNPVGRTLDAPAAVIGADIVLDQGFTANGPIRLAGATVGNQLSLINARLTDPSQVSLSLRQLRARDLDLRTEGAPQGEVDLRHASIGVLRDHPASWPTRIRLDGAVYEQLEDPLPAAQRLPWLQRDNGAYQPHPYEQLAATYRALGHEDESRIILLAKQRARRPQLPWYARAWGLAQDATVGYGYRPNRVVGWLLGLLALGTITFWMEPPQLIEESRTVTYYPFVYTLDLLLPVVNFGQSRAFTPAESVAWLAYLLTAAGWILGATVATGLARAVNRS